MTAPVRPDLQGLVGFLIALVGAAPAGRLLELRYRRSAGGMGQRFFDLTRPEATAAAIAALGRRKDVYIGPALRHTRAGTREAVAESWALWADCDGHIALAKLAAFRPSPAMVVRSGSGRNCHAYWPLSAPLHGATLESANRRLVVALGADPACAHASALLRPPGSFNHKHDPPTTVALEGLRGERFETAELLSALPDIGRSSPQRVPGGSPVVIDDPLRALAPADYVAVLTGLEPGRDGKVSCPFHRDRTPSLHVYETAEDGWYCFGCRRGGSVYDLGAALWGLPTRGCGFVELRRRLYELLLPEHEPLPVARDRGRAGVTVGR